MNKWKDIWKPKKLVCVFIENTADGFVYSAIKIRKKDLDGGNQFEEQRFVDFHELIKFYGKNIGYHFHFEGIGTLTRKTLDSPSFQSDLIVNADADDFFFTSYQLQQDIIASFFRKNVIAPILEIVELEKIQLLGITSGVIPALNLLQDQETLSLDFIVSKTDEQITRFERNEERKDRSLWGGNYLKEHEILSLAILDTYQQEYQEYKGTGIEYCAKGREDYQQAVQFKTLGLSGLLLILSLLVGNWFYTNYLNNEIAQLEADLSVSNANLSLLDRLEQEKTRKEQLVFSSGNNSNHFISFYLDQIAKSVPKSIVLSELVIFPLNDKLKNKQKVDVDRQRIHVSGTSPGNEVLDDWIEYMNRFDWVQSVELTNYTHDQGDHAEFTLLMLLK